MLDYKKIVFLPLDLPKLDIPYERIHVKTYIKPFMVNLPRAMIISTPPGGKNKIHIDCSRKKFDTLQLKFRIVLHGSTDTLYFLDKDKKLIVTII